jgi:hypothetical protein
MSPDLAAQKSESVGPIAPEGQSERQAVAVHYLDRPELEETFADSITGLFFDGQTLRIEFNVTRYDEVKANSPITGRRYPACRLVLPPAAAVDLFNRVQKIAAVLTQAGVMRTVPRPGVGAANASSSG